MQCHSKCLYCMCGGLTRAGTGTETFTVITTGSFYFVCFLFLNNIYIFLVLSSCIFFKNEGDMNMGQTCKVATDLCTVLMFYVSNSSIYFSIKRVKLFG